MAFSRVDLDWRDHVINDSSLLRPLDIVEGLADPSRANNELGWKAKCGLDDIVNMMIDAELNAQEPL